METRKGPIKKQTFAGTWSSVPNPNPSMCEACSRFPSPTRKSLKLICCHCLGAGEIVEQLGMPAALPEDLGLVLSSHTVIHNLLSFLGTACMWRADMHAGKTLINIKQNPKLKTNFNWVGYVNTLLGICL